MVWHEARTGFGKQSCLYIRKELQQLLQTCGVTQTCWRATCPYRTGLATQWPHHCDTTPNYRIAVRKSLDQSVLKSTLFRLVSAVCHPAQAVGECIASTAGLSRKKIVTTLFVRRHPPVSYRFWAGSQSVPVFVRKHHSREQYLIVASVQPQSNQIGNAPLATNATIDIGDVQVRFEARRQGSVYILDKTVDESETNGTLIQVDRWHELDHPAHWSKSFDFEAALHAGIASDAPHNAHSHRIAHRCVALARFCGLHVVYRTF